jgi:hypothetical protein
MPSPFLFQNATYVVSPPLHRFSHRFPLNSEVDAFEDPPSPSDASSPDPFPICPPDYKRHQESHRPPPHSSRMSSQQRLSSAAIHLLLPTDSTTPPPHTTDTEHHTTSLDLTKVSWIATVACNGCELRFGEPRHR